MPFILFVGSLVMIMEFMYSQRGKKLILHGGFKFYKEKKVERVEGWKWRCTVKQCKAKLYVNRDESAILKDESVHNHVQNQKLARQVLASTVRRKAREDVLERPSKVIRKEISSNANDCYEILKYEDIKCVSRSVYRERRKLSPRLQSSPGEVKEP